MYKIIFYDKENNQYEQYVFKFAMAKTLQKLVDNFDGIEISFCLKLIFSFEIFKKCWDKKLTLKKVGIKN